MADQVLFLSITTDEDLIPKSQEAVAASAMATAVSAAPAGLGYIVCGVGADIPIGDVPISDLGAGDIDVASNSITARNILFSTIASGGAASEILGEGTLNVSGDANFGSTIKGVTLSATNVTASTCPIPVPYGFMQTTTAGLASSDEEHIGADADVTVFTTKTDYISWDDSDKLFTLSFNGVYEVHAIVNLGVAATTTITLTIVKATGALESIQNQFDIRIHSAIGPQENSIATVFSALAGDEVWVTYEDDAGTEVTPTAGCTIMVRRLS